MEDYYLNLARKAYSAFATFYSQAVPGTAFNDFSQIDANEQAAWESAVKAVVQDQTCSAPATEAAAA